MNSKRARMLDSAGPRESARTLQALAARSRAARMGEAIPVEQPVEPVPLHIRSIRPDPLQPRRAMPGLLRARWCNGEDLATILHEWEGVARDLLHERGYDLPWGAWIAPAPDAELLPDLSTAHPHLRLWDELLRLAGSIYRDGLAVPITVCDSRDGYTLLMGERRLLAFWLLSWMGTENFDRIPAIVQENYDPVQQAVENGVRQNLNAIGIARQLAVLLMWYNNVPFEHAGQPDRAWYAQAADLHAPRGYAEPLATILGLKSVRQISHYRDLLALPDNVWNWADEFDWTEGKLRQMRQKAKNDRELEAMAREEVTRILAGGGKRIAVSPAQRVIRAATRAEKALETVMALDDEALRVLDGAQRRYLRELAQQLLRRL